MKRKIRRRCECGCGGITKPGNVYINRHQNRDRKHTNETKENMSKALQGRKLSEEHKRKISEALQGNTNMLDHKLSAEHKLNISLACMKYDSDNPYCDVWKSKEYKKDLRKDHCENIDCKKIYKQLDNHHIYLDKKKCAPIDIMTMCHSCHIILHRKLQRGRKLPADPKDYIIINRPDHVSYIHKKSHEIIKIRRK